MPKIADHRLFEHLVSIANQNPYVDASAGKIDLINEMINSASGLWAIPIEAIVGVDFTESLKAWTQ